MTSSVNILNGNHKLPVIRQNESAECGIACLAMIACYYGFKTDLVYLRRKFSTGLRGVTLTSLMEYAAKIGFSTRPVKLSLKLTGQLQMPAIIHWDMNHFVVLKTVKRNKFIIHDPRRGEQVLNEQEFSLHYTGIALELHPSEKFRKQKNISHLKLTDLWGRMCGLKRNLLQVFLLSVILQIFVLGSPFYLQVSVDDVLTRYDKNLLFVIAVGFAGFTLINVATHCLRAYLLLYFGSMLNFHIVRNLFHHLIRLPVDYFDKRHTGDIISRFGSTEPIRIMITEGFIAGVIDGCMAITTLSMMFYYNFLLAFIAVMAWIFYFAIRLIFYLPYRRAQEECIISEAAENTVFIETIRGISSLKLSVTEVERENIWQNRFTDFINANAKTGKQNIWFESLNQIIFGVEHILLVYVAVSLAMSGGFSTGMIFAFMAYKKNFTEKASGLIEKYIEYKMLGLHLERIADIVHEEIEDKYHDVRDSVVNKSISGKLALKNISYQYSKEAQKIIRNLNLSVEAGESIALIGASGCGKTTLFKIMVSLFKPEAGQIMLDDVPLSESGLQNYRKLIGVVMQDDNLFSGSIAENISAFDSIIKMNDVLWAAKTAVVHNDIMAMPMQYESHVGDIGNTLSGGQRQRILLARALYRRPKILFMDEGTAHLDIVTERLVAESLEKLDITRVTVAHRPETIRQMDRVYCLVDGRLKEVTDKVD